MKNMKSDRNNLLLIHTGLSTFVKGDVEILKKKYNVTIYQYDSRSWQLVVVIKQFLWLLFNVWRFDKIYIWFGDYHAFFPIIFANVFKIKSFLVVGGYDVCKIKHLKYGCFINPLRAWIVRYSMKHCTLNLCVSNYVLRKVKVITKQENNMLLFNGTNIRCENVDKSCKKEMIITVAIINDERTFYRKGIDRILKLAEELSEYDFVVIGLNNNLKRLCGESSGNVKIFARIPQKDLVDYYKQAKVYMQLSIMDTFCLALAEGMLYNCVPIVTNVGGMPEVVGDTGFVVNERSLNLLPSIVKQAMNRDYSNIYRERIEKNFLLSTRAKGLLEILNQYN